MKNFIITFLLISIYAFSYADGIIIADNENYPGRILKNKSTNVEVNIEGLTAKTITIQEFQNEWDLMIDGVYSFPLPLNARVTRLMYSKGDTLIDAVLKVLPQSTNPGTGEGGLVAEINQYMGQNVIRLKLTNMAPNAIKWIKLEYIMELNQCGGTASYTYPLDTEGFYSTPLDYLSVNINVHSEQSIANFDIPSHPDYITVSSSNNDLNLMFIKPNSYQANDIKFNYTVENPALSLDFYSWDSDTTDGYFTLVGRPLLSPTENIFPTNIVFMIDNSSTMIGEKLNQSKQAVILALDELSARDSLNIGSFNYSPSFWQSAPVVASAANIASAKTFVENIYGGNGSNIGNALSYALPQLENTTTTSSVLTFTDGKGYIDPYYIETINTNKTGIFFIAFTDKVDRHRLETTAQLNYGFVTYLDEESILSTEMLKIFKKINRPLIKDVDITFSSGNVYDLYPSKFPAIYGDSDFKITGRYTNSGSSTITIEGIEEPGNISYTFDVDFNGSNEGNDNARCFWVKDAFNDSESEILIYGETEQLKEDLIDLSLREKMRCRYTAFVEDTTYSSLTDSLFIGNETPNNISKINNLSSILNIYPNPVFKDFTIIVDLSKYQKANSKLIKMYSLNGTLLYSYDLNRTSSIIFEKSFNKSIFRSVTKFIILCLEIDGKVIETKTVVISN